MASETSSSLTNRGSLASWWKTFKRKNPVVDEVHDENNESNVDNGNDTIGKDMDKDATTTDNRFLQPQQPIPTTAQRPVLRYKSRSSNYIKPVARSSPSPSFRAHRDSFLESQKLKNNNDSQVFGVPLEQSLKLASVNISISEDLAHEGIQYGAIPVVVGKCCVFLKKNGTDVEGIFRVGGASRRVKELQFLFSTPPDYGRRFDWEGYTVHDAASLLRRFLNSLPEPLIPLALYEKFREPLRSRPHVRKFLSHKGSHKKDHKPSVKENNDLNTQADISADFDTTDADKTFDDKMIDEDSTIIENELSSSPPQAVAGSTEVTSESQITPVKVVVEQSEQISTTDAALEEKKKKKQRKIRKYKKLIGEIHGTLKDYSILLNELRPASQHLLFYILDLLTVFATHSSKNLMSIKNLAAIFQPSILSHPDHDMSPEEYALSLQVIEFMLEYYRRLLEATQKLQLEKIQEDKLQKDLVPLLQLTTDAESVRRGNESDVSTNTPVTPSSIQLHPPVSKRSGRKHSKSLSSVNPPPDGLKFEKNKEGEDKALLHHCNSNTDADDSEMEAMEKQVTPTAQVFTFDSGDQFLSPPLKPFSPLKQKRSDDSLDASNSINTNSSSLFHNFKRPLSVVFSAKDKNLSIEDVMNREDENGILDRQGRWDTGKESPKKDNWFNRLRSRSRSSEPRSAQL